MKKIRLHFNNAIYVLLLLCSILFAQSPEKKISFSFKDKPLGNALNTLIKDYDLAIAYQEKQTKNIIITAKAEDVVVEKGLDILLMSTSLTWKKSSNQYIIVPKKINAPPKTGKGKNIIKGFVRDKTNGETVPYANVVVDGYYLGDAADENGYYVITNIPDGKLKIQAMMLGYGIGEKEFMFLGGKTLSHDFLLEPSAIMGETVIKTAEREKFEQQIEPSAIQISRREIETAPSFVEADLFRTIQSLPGVITQSDFSSALYIRGGNPSENIILLDDVRIYNPYHLGGVFSTFNTDAIKSVDISLGGFPARYGNAVSSVISVTNKDGNNQEIQGKGSISLLSSKLLLEGPIPKGSFLISARRTYFDFIYNTFIKGRIDDDFNFPYYFYDFNGKINYSFSENSKLTLSGFYGDDVLYAEEDKDKYDYTIEQYRSYKETTDIRFGNFSTALKWQYIFNPRLFSETVFTRSRFRVKYDGDYMNESGRAEDLIHDYSFQNDLTWFMSDKHEMKLGLQYQQLKFKIFLKFNDYTLIDYNRKSKFYSAYIQDDWKVSPLFNIQSGVRLTYYNLGDYFRVDPRISTRYRLQDNINLKASVGLFHQYFYTFNPEDIDFLSYLRLLDLWFPIDQRYKPIQAFHYIAGLEYLFDDDKYMFSVETYYKDYDDLMDLNELGDKGERDDFLTGWGKAMGIEFLLRKQKGHFTGWIGYTLAYTRKTIMTARPSNFIENSGYEKEYQTYYPNYDRRHSLTCVAGYEMKNNWKIGGRLTFASGLPETPTVGWRSNYYVDDEPYSVTADYIPVKAEKGSYRYPAYFRIDLSIMKTYHYSKWSMQPFFQIINMSNHQNIFLYDYDLAPGYTDTGNTVQAKRKGLGMFPFVPTIGVNFEF